MNLWTKLKEAKETREKEKADEAMYRGEGERLRTSVYLKKIVTDHEITTYEYRDALRTVWLAQGKVTTISGHEVICLRSESWCCVTGAREPITPELRKQIISDLKRSKQGIFVDRSIYPEETAPPESTPD